MHLKMVESLEQRIRSERDYFEGDGCQQVQKLVFDQMTAPVPEIMDESL
jgi:hypothetical protein